MKTIYCLLGPSGSGKTTLGNYIKQELKISELVSYTTRDRRRGEKQGDPYHFVREEQFHQLNLIEAVEYGGNYYGLAEKEIHQKLDYNDKVFVIIDRHGINQLKEFCSDADVTVEVVYIYSTFLECIERMKQSRDENIVSRIENAIKDGEFDNHDIADYIVRNKQGQIDKAKKQLRCILSQ